MVERPTAIFAGNDEMAAGVLQAARQIGLSVPGDLSVVGFDDFEIARRLWPALTTIRTPTREIGRLFLGEWIVPFELISLVLMAALLGAVFFTRTEKAS